MKLHFQILILLSFFSCVLTNETNKYAEARKVLIDEFNHAKNCNYWISDKWATKENLRRKLQESESIQELKKDLQNSNEAKVFLFEIKDQMAFDIINQGWDVSYAVAQSQDGLNFMLLGVITVVIGLIDYMNNDSKRILNTGATLSVIGLCYGVRKYNDAERKLRSVGNSREFLKELDDVISKVQ